MSATVSQPLRLDRHADAVVGSDVRRGVCLRQSASAKRWMMMPATETSPRAIRLIAISNSGLPPAPEKRVSAAPSAQILIDPRIVFPARVTLA